MVQKLIIAALAFVIVFLLTCGRKQNGTPAAPGKPGAVVVRVERDTVYVPDTGKRAAYAPVPYAALPAHPAPATGLKTAPTGPNVDPGFLTPAMPTQGRPDSIFYYNDSLVTKWGNVYLVDTTRGRIVGRSWRPMLNVPMVTTTITRDSLVARRELYVSFMAQGSTMDYLSAGGGGFMYKDKKGRAYEIQALYQIANPAQAVKIQDRFLFQFSYKRKL